MSSKVWVIDDGHKSRSAKRQRVRPERGATTDVRTGGSAPTGERRGSRAAVPLWLGALAYLAGPLAPLCSSVGRRNGFLVVPGLVSGAGLLALLVWTRPIQARVEAANLPVLATLAIFAGAVLTATAVWIGGVILVWRNIPRKSVPLTLTLPWAIGVLGAMLPGFGCLLCGRKGRAVMALVSAGVLAAACFIFQNAGAIWRWNQRSGPSGASSDVLEQVFLSAVVLGFLAALAWLALALDAARLSGGMQKAGHHTGGGLALALLATMIAFVIGFDTRGVAMNLDDLGTSLHRQSFRIIPYWMSRAAASLDDAQPSYAMHLAQLSEEMGKPGLARRTRAEVARKWKSYEEMLRQEQRGAPAQPSGS